MLKSHTKKLRCFSLACIIMFCANSECNFPLHTLLADAIECFGGSTELIRIFNRLGVVTSKDTHARYVEHVVTQYEEGNHLKDLIRGRFTVTMPAICHKCIRKMCESCLLTVLGRHDHLKVMGSFAALSKNCLSINLLMLKIHWIHWKGH